MRPVNPSPSWVNTNVVGGTSRELGALADIANGPPPPPPASNVLPVSMSRVSGAVGAGIPEAPALPAGVPNVVSSIIARTNSSLQVSNSANTPFGMTSPIVVDQ